MVIRPLLRAAGLGARRPSALLTLLAVACATATATVAAAVGGLADAPWERTFAATRGAHVIGLGPPTADWEAVRGAPGVRAATGPLAIAFAALEAGRVRAPVLLRETAGATPAVDRPLLSAGRLPGPGETALERSLAAELGIGVGDRLRLGRAAVRVSGIVVSAGHEPFPASQPGLALVPRATLVAAAPDPRAHGAMLLLRLDDPARATAFAAGATGRAGGAARFEPWQERRAGARADTRTSQVILSFFTVFLLVLCAAVIATLVGARVSERARTVATLVAVGCTPRQAAAAFAAEQLAVAAVGVAAGAAAGLLLAPAFVVRSAALLGAVPAARVEPVPLLAIAAAALALAGVVAAASAWRAGRGAVVEGLRGLRRGSGRPSRAARAADRLGLPPAAVLAARDALSPPGRAGLTVLALALTVATAVAVLSMEATLDAAGRATATAPPPPGPLPAPYPAADGAQALRPVVYGLSVALLAVGLANLLATAMLAVRERAHDVALLRALGAGRRQVAAVVLGAQGLAAALAAVLGIPLGLLAFRAAYAADNGSAAGVAGPAAWQLIVMVPAAAAVVALAALPAARLAARAPAGVALRAARE